MKLAAKTANYVLEGREEFRRLEYQSSLAEYDFRKELAGFSVPKRGKVLDAGCGSGIVTRYLSELYPLAQVFGCDASKQRLLDTKKACSKYSNISLQEEDLCKLSFEDGFFDSVVCRYVLQHIASKAEKAVSELYRTVKSGGAVRLIDSDGVLVNLHSQDLTLSRDIAKIQANCPVDFFMGRKLTTLMHDAGFCELDSRVEAIGFKGEALEHEISNMESRFEFSFPILVQILGGQSVARKFVAQYLRAMRAPGSFYFHNLFIVTGRKPSKD